MEQKILHLVLKGKWYDMIEAGIKKEEYRALKPFWGNRFCSSWNKQVRAECQPPFKQFDSIIFHRGYTLNHKRMKVECLGINIGKAKPEWSDNWQGDVFIIKLGEIVEITHNSLINNQSPQ